MSQLIGKKGGNLESGYVWLPYIMVDKPIEIVESNFNTKIGISSRYSSVIINSKLKKIKKILENIEDFNVTSG
jgi:hypothetical protein